MKNRIKELMIEKKISRDDLAHAVGVHPVTISRLISGRIDLSGERLQALAKAFNVSPEAIISDTPVVPMRTVKVVAFVQAGAWAESNELPDEDQFSVAVPQDTDLAKYSLTGVQVRGPSMNLRYPEGTVLVITNAIETQEDIQPGKRYVVERERPDGLREYTVKTLHRDEEGHFWLMPESNDPRHQQPIEVNGDLGDTIRVLGRVVYSLLRED
ncbi:LexA family protein [Maritalea myrionectae]|uniref:LexA family protein n=1 Tax=Maritalea myrionectae TaxID=454601 RepID=UPI00041B40F5|nr:LexA family transcriptional regulator [Maritalea myrionectae]